MRPFQIQKILTLVNVPHQSLPAALWTDQVAATFQAQVVLYDAVTPVASERDIPLGYQVNQYNVLLQSSFNRLKNLARHIGRASQVRYIAELGVSAANLLYQAQRENADLIILNMPSLGEEISASMDGLLYNSPCPVFFTRSGQTPHIPKKILVPIRLKDGLEQKMPAVIAWAKAYQASVCLSTFLPYSSSTADTEAIEQLGNKLRSILQSEGISVERHTIRGKHFGRAMLHSVAETQSDMLVVVVEPAKFASRLFKKMMGKYFLENSPVPVLAVPLMKPAVLSANVYPDSTSTSIASRKAAPTKAVAG